MTTTIDLHSLTEAEAARLLGRIDWTLWGCWQTVHQKVGKGATGFLRDTADRLGLGYEVKRAGIDVIYVKLTQEA
jgi:hypothetical protein